VFAGVLLRLIQHEFVDILQADLSVLPASTLSQLSTWLTNAIQLRISGAQPEAAEEANVAGLAIKRTSMKDLTELLASVGRAQAIQAASNGGLNIARSVRRGGSGGYSGFRRSSFQ
jgi:hypothetical protein